MLEILKKELVRKDATHLNENEVIYIDGEQLVFVEWKHYRGRGRSVEPLINLNVIRVRDGQHMRYRRPISLKVDVIGTYIPPTKESTSNPFNYNSGQLFVIAEKNKTKLYRFTERFNESKILAKNPATNRGVKIDVNGFTFIKIEDLPY